MISSAHSIPSTGNLWLFVPTAKMLSLQLRLVGTKSAVGPTFFWKRQNVFPLVTLESSEVFRKLYLPHQKTKSLIICLQLLPLSRFPLALLINGVNVG